MVHIIVDNIWCEVIASDDIHKLLFDKLKYRADGYKYSYLFKTKKWDGYTHLYDKKTHKARRGLLSRILKLLKDEEVDVAYHPVSASTIDVKSDFSSIRPYEFQQTIPKIAKENDIGIVVSPTGSGKTISIALTIDEIKYKTIVLVTDLVLLDQMQIALQRLFKQPIGVIGDGVFDLQDITVSTVQSLLAITKLSSVSAADRMRELKTHLENVGMVISDEAHLYDTDGIAKIMPLFKHTQKFVGMSATPFGWDEDSEKSSNLALEQHFGHIIYDTRKLDFIKLGLKTQLIVHQYTIAPLNYTYTKHKSKFRGKEYPDHSKNYRDALETEILTNDRYHDYVAEKALAMMKDGRSVFVHAAHSIEFGEKIHAKIPGSKLINGQTSREDRRVIYDDLKAKKILCLVSDLGGTGLDIPSLDCLVLASDLKDVRQLAGRVTRAAPGKVAGTIIDIGIDTQYLKKHATIREHQYKSLGGLIIPQ